MMQNILKGALIEKKTNNARIFCCCRDPGLGRSPTFRQKQLFFETKKSYENVFSALDPLHGNSAPMNDMNNIIIDSAQVAPVGTTLGI